MLLYLVQHGEALPAEVDSRRPLSARGAAAVQRVADFAARNCHITGSRIQHSGKLRAGQTAEIFATTLHLPVPDRVDHLEPLADPAIWQERLTESGADLMLVGHLPFLSRLASVLLCNDPARDLVQFRMGGLVALQRDNKLWTIKWLIIPDILPVGNGTVIIS
jgi:phosphohistidine phosphatase